MSVFIKLFLHIFFLPKTLFFTPDHLFWNTDYNLLYYSVFADKG